VVESKAQVPWFSGFCLEGEVAGQYEMERSDIQQEPEDTTESGLLALDGLAPITIFVGANNSGKSRLLRELFRIQELTRLRLTSRDSEGVEVDIGSESPSWMRTILNSEGQAGDVCVNGWIVEEKRSMIEACLKTLDHRVAEAKNKAFHGMLESLEGVKKRISSCGVNDKIRGFHEAKRCYVPMLRGMRPPLTPDLAGQAKEVGVDDLYKSRTRHDYFFGHDDLRSRGGYGDQQIFTGLGLYGNLRERLLARTQAIRDSVSKYELFLSEHFFAGQGVTLVPVEDGHNDVVHIKIGDNADYPIHQLGDGMQSLIICTYPIVTEIEPGSLFFLEEPDLCMHPSLQRAFLEVLKTYHREMGHQFFLTTHSNHLLDLLEDIALVSIFSFSEIAGETTSCVDSSQADGRAGSESSKLEPRFRIRASSLRDRQTLLELGVRPSATFLANATIWVEGVSDCAYLRAYMEAFVHYLKRRGGLWGETLAQRLEQYKEDRHYAFVEYSGANLVHFDFEDEVYDDDTAEARPNRGTSVPDLCAKAIVIADGDIADKVKRLIFYANQLKERFIVLPCKEIENMIPEALMKKQIFNDHAPPKRKRVERGKIERPSYVKYSRSKEGIGMYLGGNDKCDIETYLGTFSNGGAYGTLPGKYKKRWRSEVEGIPALLRESIKSESVASKTGQDDEAGISVDNGDCVQVPDLPSYFTQDLIWLGVCLYAHIAECNHDQEAMAKLKDFQEFVRHQGRDPQEASGASRGDSQHSSESVNPAPFAAPEWPIQDAANRTCLLSSYPPVVEQLRIAP
jgi:hypothetical protein